jgi:hypothetical protein
MDRFRFLDPDGGVTSWLIKFFGGITVTSVNCQDSSRDLMCIPTGPMKMFIYCANFVSRFVNVCPILLPVHSSSIHTSYPLRAPVRHCHVVDN